MREMVNRARAMVLPKTMDYGLVFGQNLKILTLAKKDTIRKGISRGAEWRKFQLHSTFQRGVKRPQRMSRISVKTPYYSPWFSAKI